MARGRRSSVATGWLVSRRGQAAPPVRVTALETQSSTQVVVVVVVAFIDSVKQRFGAEPVCRVLSQIWNDPDGNRQPAGDRTRWRPMHKPHVTVDGRPVARCSIEWLMRDLGLVGRDVTASAPNRWSAVDFTYLDTEAGKAFAATSTITA